MRIQRTIILAWLLAIAPLSAAAGEFSVSPIVLNLSKTNKSGSLVVSNDGLEKITMQVRAMEWKQDGEGKDVYTDTNDIVFFPKITAIAKGDSQLVRVGIKDAVAGHEKTYRLFIQEIQDPDAASPGKKGKVQVAVKIRFGVPLFVKPETERTTGMVERIVLEKGTATAVVKNTGTVHFKIKHIVLTGTSPDGREIFSKELESWYLLAGVARVYSVPIPPDICGSLAHIELKVKGDALEVSGTQATAKEMCER